MKPSTESRGWLALGWRVGLAGLVLGIVLRNAARTPEWGNLLHHVGAFGAAADAYRDAREGESWPQPVAYNLGTTLLAAGSDEAERYLELAAGGPDSTVAQRAHYNVGYRLLESAEGATDPVAGVGMLLGAIRNNRAALRMNPLDEDARWNLAVAERRYQSYSNLYEEGPAEPSGGEAEGPPEESEGTGTAPGFGSGSDDEGEAQDNAGDEAGGGRGAGETLLGEGDPGPLTGREALRLLETVADEPALLVRGVLWSQRPRPEGP